MHLKKITLFLIVPILLCVATYAVFDRYLGSTSYELLNAWLKNESVAIQEGQILSSITKNKRSVMASDFVRGIWLVDDSKPYVLTTMADFGEKYPLDRKLLPNKVGEVSVERISAFHRLALYRFPSRSDLVVIFNVQPDFVAGLFGANIAAIAALLLIFFFITRSIEKRETEAKLQVITEQAKLGAFARQISHDLKSPLTALDISVKTLKDISEPKRLEIQGAVSGLRDIINSLVEKSYSRLDTNQTNKVSTAGDGFIKPQLLSTLIEQQVSISRLQYKQRHGLDISAVLESESYGIFSSVNPTEFKRVISNLLSNAAEASQDEGRVSIELERDGADAIVLVKDNGKGIPIEVLPKIGTLGFSHDKPGGRGSGLHFVKTAIESWNGTFSIESNETGTTARICLPLAKAPSWFAPEIQIVQGNSVVILDDAQTIHQVWKNRLSTIVPSDAQISVLSASSSSELLHPPGLDLIGALESRQTLYLCDYELSDGSKTGLDVILELGIAARSILVTSYADDAELLDRCEQHGIKVLPKNLAGLVPILIAEPKLALDGVLIDNDALVHKSWELSAIRNGKTLQRFFNVEEFLVAADSLDRETPIYVDSDLGDAVRGEEMARYIHESGFKQIYLQTGSNASQFTKPMPWIRSILGKEPPWEGAV